MEDDKANLNKFLEKVNLLESCMKELNSSDDQVRTAAISKADELIEKFQGDSQKDDNVPEKPKYPPRDNTGVNRTVINQNAFDTMDQAPGPVQDPAMGQEGFMKMLEKDAQERAARRKANIAASDELKEKGNAEFKEGRFEKAVEHYTEALSIFRDTTVLWTNRAQAYIKLGKFEDAISDCDWALRVFDNCVKAHIHKGRAYLQLKKYDDAIESFNAAIKCQPEKETVIQGYIAEVELARKAAEQEEAAQQFLAQGSIAAKGIVQVLDKLYEENQLPMYYSGGLRIIVEALKNSNERTLFRTHKGLLLTTNHKYISRCFNASPRSLNREELDLCAAVVQAFTSACTDNEENQKELLEVSGLSEQLLRLLETSVKHSRLVKEATVSLLHTLSQDQVGRAKIIATMDLSKLLECIFQLMKAKGVVAIRAAGLLNNIALNKKFKAKMRETIETDVLPAFETLMREGGSNAAILPSCISTVTNLSGDDRIRAKVISREQTWQACSSVLEKHRARVCEEMGEETLFSALGLLINMCVTRSEHLLGHAPTLCQHCLFLLKANSPERVGGRCVGLVARLTPVCQPAAQCVLDEGGIDILLHNLKGGGEVEFVKCCMKALTGCTAVLEATRHAVLDYRNEKTGLKILADLLKVKDENIIGNAALCLGHLVDSKPEIGAKFVKTNCIQDLLVLARDSHDKNTQHNCAILTAKLVQADPRNLERLRELHGTEILHDVLTQVEKK